MLHYARSEMQPAAFVEVWKDDALLVRFDRADGMMGIQTDGNDHESA